MFKAFGVYKKLEKHILYLLIAQFFIQLVNTSFFLLLNYYMVDQGYQDHEVARFISFRFLAIMFFAAPFGLLIKGKRLKPFFYIGAIATPTMALIIIYAAAEQMHALLSVAFMLWGVGFICMQVTMLPYIILNARQEHHTDAIAISFQTFSLGIFIVGILSFTLNRYLSEIFTEKVLLQMYAIAAYVAVFFVSRVKVTERPTHVVKLKDILKEYDFGLIARAVTPTFILAVGAGITIPFINLFFLNVHGVKADNFSLMGSATYLLVAVGVLFIPGIKRRFGYKVAITLIQSLGVVVLVLMATTELYAQWKYAVYIAIFFFIIRQPLMHLAGPMTSELSLYYVGKKNQELISSLNASIWNGSFFFSSQIFRVLRQAEFSYVSIFMITAALYTFGVIMYAFLIRDYHRRRDKGLTDH